VASALHGLGSLHFRQNEPDAARACFESTLAIGRELDDTQLVAASLNNLGNVALRAVNEGGTEPVGLDALALYEESLRLWRELGDDLRAAAVLGDLAVILVRAGRHGEATVLLSEGAGIYRGLGHRQGFAAYTTKLAALARHQADYAGARSVLEELLQVGREMRDPSLEARSLIELGDLWWVEGNRGEARRLYEDAATIARTLDHCWPLYEALHGLGQLALLRGDVARARSLFEEAAAAAEEEEPGIDDPWSMVSMANAALADGDRVGAAELCRAVVTLLGITQSRPGPLTAALDVLTVLDANAGALDRAAMLVGASDAIRARMASPGFAPFRSTDEYERAQTAVREGLEEAAFASAHAAGAAMAFEDAIALAESALA
jgi:tetratricopeptide (TPR) repeat protein